MKELLKLMVALWIFLPIALSLLVLLMVAVVLMNIF